MVEGGTGQGGRAGPSLRAEPWRPDCPVEGEKARLVRPWGPGHCSAHRQGPAFPSEPIITTLNFQHHFPGPLGGGTPRWGTSSEPQEVAARLGESWGTQGWRPLTHTCQT